MLNVIKQRLKQLFWWGWDSPTATAWAGQGAQVLRVLLLTPLLISRFSLTEIASWYLFASTTFLGAILCQRSKMTFSRMVSMAVGGARELIPIKPGQQTVQVESEAETKELLRTLCSTFSSLFILIALLSLLVSSATGYFALQELNNDATNISRVCFAFVVFLFGNFFVNATSKYDSLLQGLGHVSLVNRINVGGALLSVALGSLSLCFGADIFILACIVQAVTVVNLLLFRYFASLELKGLGISGVDWRIDSQCISWAKEPLVKGFVSQLCINGVMQFSAILIPFYYSATIVATYLFSLRIFQMIVSFSMAPTFSYQPVFAKLLAAGEIARFRDVVVRKSRLSLIVFVLASVFAGVGISYGIKFLNTELVFMPIKIWLLLTGLALLERFNMICRMICSVGNHIILVRQYVLIGGVSLSLLMLTGNEHMMVFIVLSLWGPPALLPGFSALKYASRLLQVKRKYILTSVLVPALVFLSVFVALNIYVL